MKKYKIVGGIALGIVAINVGVMLYLDLTRHINDIVTEEDANPDQPRMSIHQALSLAVERALNEKFGLA